MTGVESASEVFFSLPANLARLLILFGALTLVVYLELKTGRIPNPVTLSVWVLGLAANITFGAVEGTHGAVEAAKWALIGSLAGFLIYFFFYLVGYMLNYKFIGGGDVKLMAAIGAVAGPIFTLQTIYWTIWIAALMGIYSLLKHKVFLRGLVRSMRIFFLMPPDKADDKPLVEGGVSYGLAIALGAALAFLFRQGFQ